MERGLIVKTFRLIEVLAGSSAAVSLGEIASAAALAKPTVHRILNDLVRLGYVRRQEAGVYRLSNRFRHLGMDLHHRRLVSLAEPILQQLHRSTGEETVNLAVPRLMGITYVAVLPSVHPLQRVVEVMETAPYHSSALGWAIMAHLSPTEREAYLKRASLKPVTSHTVVDPAQWQALLEQVKAQGYAVELNQADQGVGCTAAPVFQDEEPIAAISVSVPLARVDEQQLHQLALHVCTATAQLTRFMQSEKELI